MVHVPTAASVTVELETVQVEPVCELKLTASPDVAVALTVNVPEPNTRLESAPNVIVCRVPWVTWKLWFTGVAGA